MSNIIHLAETQVYTPTKIEFVSLSVFALLSDRRPGINFVCRCYQRNNKWFLKVTSTQAEKTNFYLGPECALVQSVVESQFKYAAITKHSKHDITFLVDVCKKFERVQQLSNKQRDTETSLRTTIARAVYDQAFKLDITDDVESLSTMVDVVADAVLAKYKVTPK